MASSFFIFLIGCLSVLSHVTALPTNKKANVLSQPKNCIHMTKETEDKINEIVYKVSEYLYNVSVEYDIFDIYMLQLGIEKHIEDDTEEKELQMKLKINDCSTVPTDDYYKSTMDLKFDGDTASENINQNIPAQTKQEPNNNVNEQNIKDGKPQEHANVSKETKEGKSKPNKNKGKHLTAAKDSETKKNKSQKPNEISKEKNQDKNKSRENFNKKHRVAENDKQSQKINANHKNGNGVIDKGVESHRKSNNRTKNKQNKPHEKDSNAKKTHKGENKQRKINGTDDINKNVKKSGQSNKNQNKPKETNQSNQIAQKPKPAKGSENKTNKKVGQDSFWKVEWKINDTNKKSNKTKAKTDKKSKNPIDDIELNNNRDKKSDGAEKREIKEDRNKTAANGDNASTKGKPDDPNKKSDPKINEKVKNIWKSGDEPVFMELKLDEDGEKLLRTLEEKRGKLWPLLMYVQKFGDATEYVFLNK